MKITIFKPGRSEDCLMLGITSTTYGSRLKHYSDGRILHYTYFYISLLCMRLQILVEWHTKGVSLNISEN